MSIKTKLKREGLRIFFLAVFSWLISLLFVSCNNRPLEGMVIAVEIPQGEENSFEGASIIAINPLLPDQAATKLSEDFHSACSPVLSNNARYLIFSGKKEQSGPWQIWLTDLKQLKTKRVTDLPENCTDPAFLPDGKIVFSRTGSMAGRDVTNLFKCNMDGTDLRQLTFHPNFDYAATVLQDGRILFTSSQQIPAEKVPEMLVMRPDGTKCELYYTGGEGTFPESCRSESKEGFIYFTQRSTRQQPGGHLMRLHRNRPLHSAVDLSEGLAASFRSAISFKGDTCLVSCQLAAGAPFELYYFDSRNRKILEKVYGSEGNVVDPLVVSMKKRPPILPSAVNPENPTGLLMSQDINHSMVPVNEQVGADSASDRIQVLGLEGMMKEVEVMEDGSFYLKVDADIPFQIQTLNNRGEIIRGPSDWIWLRPNERRGCVGCHADPELAPENRQPLAVQHPPVIITATEKDISKLEEPGS